MALNSSALAPQAAKEATLQQTFTRKQRVRIASLGPYIPNPDKGVVEGGIGTVMDVAGFFVYVTTDGFPQDFIAFRPHELVPLVDVRLPGLDGE